MSATDLSRPAPALSRRAVRIAIWTPIGLAASLAVIDQLALWHVVASQGARFVNGVFLFWGWSAFLHGHPAALLYDHRVLHRFMAGLPGSPRRDLPFVYPPSALLFLWPVAWAAPVPSFIVWSAASFAAYVLASWRRDVRLATLGLAAIVPSTFDALFAGQTALFAAALMIGACRALPRRPLLAGVLFGLLTVKPQYGVLVPVALLAARQWRAIAAAVATALVLVVLGGVVFGWGGWLRLPLALAALSREVAADPRFAQFSPTFASGLRILGLSGGIAMVLEAAVALAATAAIWVVFRRPFSPFAMAAMMAGAFLVTPYAAQYDLPVVSFAAWAFACAAWQAPGGISALEAGMVGLVALLPMLERAVAAPWGMVVLGPFFVLCIRRALRVPVPSPT